jgi:hypothetical protein
MSKFIYRDVDRLLIGRAGVHAFFEEHLLCGSIPPFVLASRTRHCGETGSNERAIF